MSGRICLVLLLGCASCSADRPGNAAKPEQDAGWPVIGIRGSPSAGSIAWACTLEEPRFGDRPADFEGEFRAYAVRDPVCSTERRKRGRAQCTFELGETRRKFSDDNDTAARSVKRWQTARASLSYRRVGFGEEWTESWWADGPCRP